MTGQAENSPPGQVYPVAEHVDDCSDAEDLVRLFAPAMSVNREGVVITDSLDSREPIIYVNRGFERITGYSADEVIGRNCRFLQGPGTDPERTDRIRKALAEGTDVVVELLNYRKDGSEFWNLVSITPIFDPSGRLVHRIGLQLDVTQRRLAEMALSEANQQLERRVEKRTEQLRQVNENLRREVSERRGAERRLLEHQQHLRRLASQLSSAEDRQRRQIASDLHDRLSQGLVALKLNLETLLQANLQPDRLERFRPILDTLDQLVEETRTMMFDLCPPMLYDLGLSAAVEELVRHFAAQTSLHCEFVDDGRCASLSQELRSFLYRAVRELLINVAKHARASQAVVSLSRDRKTLSISVEDDGVGFDLDPQHPADRAGLHFGLFHIRERLSHFGGWMLNEAEPGQGASVTLIVPVGDEPAEAPQPEGGKP